MISEYKITKEQTLEDYLKARHLSSKNIYKLCLLKAITNKDKFLTKEDILYPNDEIYINYSLFETTEYIYDNKDKKDINILYEDSEIIAIDKSFNILIHSDGTNAPALLNYINNYLYQKGDDSFVRPLHRIDYETKGICLFSKNILAHSEIDYQIANNLVYKRYNALARGIIKDDGKITILIGRNRHDSKKYIVSKTGKEAITNYKIVKYIGDNTLLDVIIETGRTHQIRVSLAHIKHNIVGDKLYGENEKGDLKLISKEMEFKLDSKIINLISNINNG